VSTGPLCPHVYVESLSDTAVAANDETFEQPSAFAQQISVAPLTGSSGVAATTLYRTTSGATFMYVEAENDYYLGGYAGI
jgi:hypothetical protein